MQSLYVKIPKSLLLSSNLSTSSKAVWMALQLPTHGRTKPFSCTVIARQLGLSRPTVYKAMRELKQAGWHPFPSPEKPAEQPWVRVPGHLVTDSSIPAIAKVFYGLLQMHRSALPSESKGRVVCFTYSSLAKLLGWHRKTVSKAVRTLARAGWLKTTRTSRRFPAHCEFKDPRLAPSEAEVERIKRRLGKASFTGEAIMREFLSLLVDSEQYEDDAAPGFLVNPLTDERLQLDRYYPPAVAFEFNGPQHYEATELYSSEVVSQQKVRDLIKLGICASRGITLRIVHAEDLSLAKMRRIIGHLLPLRDLKYEGPRIAYLEYVARTYRRAASRGQFPRREGAGGEASTAGTVAHALPPPA